MPQMLRFAVGGIRKLHNHELHKRVVTSCLFRRLSFDETTKKEELSYIKLSFRYRYASCAYMCPLATKSVSTFFLFRPINICLEDASRTIKRQNNIGVALSNRRRYQTRADLHSFFFFLFSFSIIRAELIVHSLQ